MSPRRPTTTRTPAHDVRSMGTTARKWSTTSSSTTRTVHNRPGSQDEDEHGDNGRPFWRSGRCGGWHWLTPCLPTPMVVYTQVCSSVVHPFSDVFRPSLSSVAPLRILLLHVSMSSLTVVVRQEHVRNSLRFDKAGWCGQAQWQQ